MIKFPSNVLTFAAGNDEAVALYESFVDYWQHYRHNQGNKNVGFSAELSFDEKESKLNAALKKEILRVAGIVDIQKFPLEQWANHPVIKWAAFAVVSALVDMVLPQSMVENIGAYTDVKVGGFGDSFAFEVKPRDLFVVSKAGRSQRVAQIQKQFNGMVTIIPEPYAVTTGVSMYRVLAGKESLAEFVAKMVRAMEIEMTKQAYTLFNTTAAALSNTASTGLRIAGFTSDSFIDLCQRVSGWNQGAKAVAMGTARALQNVLPTDANYRYSLSDSYVTLGYVPTYATYDLLVVPQVMDWTNPFASLIDDTHIWILSPSSQKILKLCLEGSTLSNTTDYYDSASLQQTSTIWKSWGLGVCTNSVMGLIELS